MAPVSTACSEIGPGSFEGVEGGSGDGGGRGLSEGVTIIGIGCGGIGVGEGVGVGTVGVGAGVGAGAGVGVGAGVGAGVGTDSGAGAGASSAARLLRARSPPGAEDAHTPSTSVGSSVSVPRGSTQSVIRTGSSTLIGFEIF